MTTLEALVSIAQCLLRHRGQWRVGFGRSRYELMFDAWVAIREAAELCHTGDQALMRAAAAELERRF